MKVDGKKMTRNNTIWMSILFELTHEEKGKLWMEAGKSEKGLKV